MIDRSTPTHSVRQPLLWCHINLAAERSEATGRHLFVQVPTAMIALVVLVAATILIPPMRWWHLLLAFGATLLTAYSIVRWQNLRASTRFCEAARGDSIGHFVQMAIQTGRMNLPRTLQMIARNVAGRPDSPSALVVATNSLELKADPFDRAFEPLHLDALDSAFRRFCRENNCSEPKKRFEITDISLLKHAWIAVAVILILGTGAGFRRVFRDAEVFLQTGRVTPQLGFWAVLLLASLIGWVRRPFRRTQYFVAPAAFIARRLSGRPERWHVELFTRDNSLMLLAPINETHWYVVLAKPDGPAVSKYVTPLEVTVLLRAWLSPLPPPTLDKLSDLQ